MLIFPYTKRNRQGSRPRRLVRYRGPKREEFATAFEKPNHVVVASCHLVYTSTSTVQQAVFSTLCARQFDVAWVSSRFFDGVPLANSSNPDLSLDANINANTTTMVAEVLEGYQKNQTSSVRLENKAYAHFLNAPIISSVLDLILITNYSNLTTSLYNYQPYLDSQLYCEAGGLDTSNCAFSPASHWELINQNAPYTSEILPISLEYCLSRPIEEHCKLQFSLAIMIVVITCNLIKTICMSWMAWKRDPEPLVTIGDAIASFVNRPDVTTEGNCIAGKARFEGNKCWDLPYSKWRPKRPHLFRAASLRRWVFCNIL